MSIFQVFIIDYDLQLKKKKTKNHFLYQGAEEGIMDETHAHGISFGEQ